MTTKLAEHPDGIVLMEVSLSKGVCCSVSYPADRGGHIELTVAEAEWVGLQLRLFAERIKETLEQTDQKIQQEEKP